MRLGSRTYGAQMSPLPPDVETFTRTVAQLLQEAGLATRSDSDGPGDLGAIPQDYLMDSLIVMRRVGLDAAETACLSAIYLGVNQVRLMTDVAADATAWPGQFDGLAEAGRKRLLKGRLEPLFLLFETALSEQMALRRRTMT